MKIFNIFIFTCFISLTAFSQPRENSTEPLPEMSFLRDNFKEALAQAKATHKMVFFDAYTTWCGPCKMMVRKTFTDTSVAAFYNEHFVNITIEMESGDGPALQQRYKITAYPTLLFLNEDGGLVHKAVGFHDAQQFLALGKAALTTDETFISWVNRYESGQKDPVFLKTYAEKLLEANDDRRFVIAEQYLSTQNNRLTPENLEFSMRFTEGVETSFFKFLIDNQKAFETKFTKDEIDLKIQDLVYDFLLDEKHLPTLPHADSIIKAVYPDKFDRMSLNYRLNYYRLKGQRTEYAQAAITYLKKYNDNIDDLHEVTATFLEQIDEPKALNKAVKWAKKVIKMESNVDNQMTLAQLYNKLGKTSKAKVATQKAIEIGKKTGEQYAEAEELLKTFK